ncbi:hypothetical protein EIN_084750 [Entamoeba invadens IP1]|uniref:hypothetical protein n=1 Tax=Entamoeba invadens IP1 TaxID=370355 RepID=UPI0002C3F53E|nr:hypothetical protein EIN_084750 [Entamoeba invadens IP1]ELP85273.1 hypothetical protein EIN_084750 [Entamoeba invadens IP1]|eukprot:XP_004184619.1 hypothetical protein EIN_084750 [Entamoeba invadens IP1]
MEYNILFTTQKTQKQKKWQDGYAKYIPATHKFEVYDIQNTKHVYLTSKIVKTPPNIGDLIELEKYIVDIDSVASGELPKQVEQTTQQTKLTQLTKPRKLHHTIKPLLTMTPQKSLLKDPLIKKTEEKPKNTVHSLLTIFTQPQQIPQQKSNEIHDIKKERNPQSVNQDDTKKQRLSHSNCISKQIAESKGNAKVEKNEHTSIMETLSKLKSEINCDTAQPTTKKVLSNGLVKRTRLLGNAFKVPKAMQMLTFPMNLTDSERVLEKFRNFKDTCLARYTSLDKYVTDMNNIVVNEMNFHFAELAHQFYTLVDTQAIGLGASGRLKICEHGVAKCQICRKDGPNKGKPFYTCPERKCKAFKWDDTKLDTLKMRFDMPLSLDTSISLTDLNFQAFYTSGIIAFPDAEVFVSNKIVLPKEEGDDETTKTTWYLKINSFSKTKGLKKDDLWVVLPQEYPYKLSSRFYVVAALYHSPTSDGLMAVDVVTPFPPNFKRMKCAVLNASCSSTELLMLQTLTQLSITPPTLITPLLNYLMFHTFTKTENVIMPDISLIDQYSLNTPQRSVIQNVVLSLLGAFPPLTLVHGVFGAGKSHLLSVLCILLSSLNYRVLVCASTNVAVDRVLESLLSKGFTSFSRVGSLKKISRLILPHTLSETNGLSELRTIKKDVTLTHAEREIVEKEIKERKSGMIKRRNEEIKKSLIVGVTCASSTNELLGDQYDVVLLDEATQTIEPLILIPLLRFTPKVLVCVGDPMQLDPVLQIENRCATIFQRVLSIETPLMLNVQYRCSPPISGIVNRMYYHGLLVDGDNVLERKSLIEGGSEVIIFYHEVDDEKMSKGSYSSSYERVVMKEIVNEIKGTVDMKNVGVMAFYKEQCELLATDLKKEDVTVATIDAFQGAEKDVVMISFVRNKESSFLENAKRLNVAITRARNNLILVMHHNILKNDFMQSLIRGVKVSFVDCEIFLQMKKLMFES